MFLFRHLSVIFLLLLTFSTNLSALSVTPPTKTKQETLRTLIKTDQLIILGMVQGQSSYYGKDDRIREAEAVILTDVFIRIEKVFKGSVSSDIIAVKTLGGCIEEDNICLHTEVSPSFNEGEKVILFLNPVPDGKWHIWDFVDGKQTLYQGLFHPLGFSLEKITNLIIENAQ